MKRLMSFNANTHSNLPTSRGLPMLRALPTSRGLSAGSTLAREQWIPRTSRRTLMSWALAFLLFSCFHGLVFAKVTATLDKDQVQVGQIFTLSLKLVGSQISPVPDFMALQKDFTIEGTQSNVNYNIEGGKVESSSEWVLTLSAKKAGNLTIPALKFGNETTEPLSIEVLQETPLPPTKEPSLSPKTDDNSKPSPAKKQQQDVLLMTDISTTTPYVNQQIIYTVKLFNASRLLDANYQPPQVEDALFIPLGNGRRYQVNENNRIYAVEEQQFAVFPQTSGYLKIKPPSFTALIYDLTPKRITVDAQATTLDVKPIPTDFQGQHWLPAKQVTLSENYDKNTASLAEGTTLTRTVVLQAVAVPAQLLPNLNFDSSPQFSIYPEKPVEFNQIKDQDLVGRSTFKVTYLLNKAGKVTIPGLTLPWFNTITGKKEISTLPELTLDVTPTTSSQANTPVAAEPVAPVQKVPQLPTPIPAQKEPTNFAWWVAAAFALAWLLTALAWIWQRKNAGFRNPNKNQIMKELQEACANNKPEKARTAVLKWGRMQWPKATLLNLFDLEQLVEEPNLKQQINQLAQVLYQDAKLQKDWKGTELWQAILKFRTASASKSVKENPLPPINKL